MINFGLEILSRINYLIYAETFLKDANFLPKLINKYNEEIKINSKLKKVRDRQYPTKTMRDTDDLTFLTNTPAQAESQCIT